MHNPLVLSKILPTAVAHAKWLAAVMPAAALCGGFVASLRDIQHRAIVPHNEGYVNSALLVAPHSHSTVVLAGYWVVSTVYCQRGLYPILLDSCKGMIPHV